MAEEKKLSLSDIMGNKDDNTKKKNNKYTRTGTNKTVSLKDIAPDIDKPVKEETVEDDYLKLMDTELEKRQNFLVENVIQPFKEECIAIALEAEEMEAAGIISDKNNVEEVRAALAKRRSEEEIIIDAPKETSVDDDLLELEENDIKGDTIVMEMNSKNSILEAQQEMSLDNLEEPELNTMEIVEESKEEHDTQINPKDKIVHITPANEIPESPVKETFVLPEVNTESTLEQIADDDLEGLLTADDAEETEDEKEDRKRRQEEFRQEVFNKLNLHSKLDKSGIKKFTISSKPISVNKVLKTNNNAINSATWALPNSGRLITFSALSGEEIENLNPAAHENGLTDELANRLTFNTLYNHLIDSNKPDSMEKWLRTINWFDINDIYFAIYLATFKNSNYITYTCSNKKCNNMFLEQKSYQDMIKYTDDKSKETYQNIFKTGIDATPDSIEEEIVPINDNYAIGFRAPSVYDIMFGASALDQSFRTKYATTIGNISYMANIYFIKHEADGTGILFPVDCKPIENDPAKTMRNKIIAYYNILKTLASDEYSVVTRSIEDINSKSKVMATFHYPNHACPKCKTLIKREDDSLNPLIMVFIRHQLVRFASSTIE